MKSKNYKVRFSCVYVLTINRYKLKVFPLINYNANLHQELIPVNSNLCNKHNTRLQFIATYYNILGFEFVINY